MPHSEDFSLPQDAAQRLPAIQVFVVNKWSYGPIRFIQISGSLILTIFLLSLR